MTIKYLVLNFEDCFFCLFRLIDNESIAAVCDATMLTVVKKADFKKSNLHGKRKQLFMKWQWESFISSVKITIPVAG